MAPSNIGFLEHVNLTVPKGPEAHALARAFYFGVLGCAEDPRPVQLMGRHGGLLWANAGLQQFHLPAAEQAQVLRGRIVIEVADLDAVAGNAERAMRDGTFRRTEFSMRRVQYAPPLAFEGAKDALLLTCPWGNKIVAVEAAPAEGLAADKARWINPHDAVRSKGHPKLEGEGPTLATGIRAVEFSVPAPALPHIARHFRDLLGAKVSSVNLSESIPGDGGEEVGRRLGVVAWVGPRNEQWISFAEHPGAERWAYDGHHLALYIGAFEASHDLAASRRLIFADHKFQHLDRAEDWEKVQQYRLLEISDGEGKRAWEIELEVRSFANRFCPVVREAVEGGEGEAARL
ncbi:hypothetical protein DFJ74DRAFT_763738 [Hyaloraphidium curvatum]|nr:hypothetical protein DFJ74DRAFT_763738 [Hyaloraphidium curvatum]